jgi:hypothetical protein
MFSLCCAVAERGQGIERAEWVAYQVLDRGVEEAIRKAKDRYWAHDVLETIECASMEEALAMAREKHEQRTATLEPA